MQFLQQFDIILRVDLGSAEENNTLQMESNQYSPTMKDNKYFNLQQLINANDLCSKMGYYMGKQGNNDKVYQKKVFLMMGTTTSGKTVTQYYLCQDALVYGIEQSKKLPFIIPQNIYQNAIVQKTPNTITTRIPNIRLTPHDQVLIIEVPDINQLKPEEQSLEYLFLHKIFKQTMELHIIVVIEETSLSDFSEIMNSFQCVISLFDIKEQNVRGLISQSLSIVVNKVSEDSEYQDVKASLEQVNDEAIAQESQQLSQIITSVLKQQRVYLIKDTQPQANQQQELLKNLLQNSKFISFSQLNLLGSYLDQINIEDESVVEAMINKLRVRQLWESGVNAVSKLVRFLTDRKIWQQENGDNMKLIGQVRQMVHRDQQQLHQQYQSEHNNASSIFRGKKPCNTVLALLQKWIKAINSYHEQQQGQSATLFNYTVGVIELLKELRIEIRKQLLTLITPIANLQDVDKLIDYCNSTLSLRQLLKQITHLETILLYITRILNYKSEPNQSPQQSQLQHFHHSCLVQLTKQLVENIKLAFTDFDLSLLKTKRKHLKQSLKKTKTVVVKKPNPTIQQLKRQFLNQINQKRNTNLINQITNLPLSHFKLYLLIDQFKQYNNQTNTNSSKFPQLSILIKQIASILHSYQFYVQQIKFLLVIPDWNRIVIAIESMQRYQKTNNGNNRIDEKDIEFINKVGIYAQQFMLNKVATKIFSMVDQFIYKQIQNDNILQDDQQSYIAQRQGRENLYDKWEIAYLQQEYRQQPGSLLWKIIQKAKLYEQLHRERITRFNQQMLLMKQRFN